MTPGTARDRECYLLGDVKDEGLAAALVEEFLGEVRACVWGEGLRGVVCVGGGGGRGACCSPG